jgi:hypothetical protein
VYWGKTQRKYNIWSLPKKIGSKNILKSGLKEWANTVGRTEFQV